MAIAYFDTNSGIAGDMTLAALVDAGADQQYIAQQIQSLGLPEVKLLFSETQRHCFRALMLDIEHPPEHAHRHWSDIRQMLEQSKLTDAELHTAKRLFECIAVAEAKVHGSSLEEVHFHEVGAIDSIVDIVGTAVALQSLGIDQVIASPTPTGSGQIKIAHGTVAVPAPATAEILTGVPIRSCSIEAELTTPTGAAILRTLADDFGPLPDMQIQRIGYGSGHKELKEQANILRVLIGNSWAPSEDRVLLLETNLDDITGEQLGFAIERLWEVEALDVFTTAIGMKKNRPAVMLSVLAMPEHRVAIEQCLFQHTGALGIRHTLLQRSKLQRKSLQVETRLGSVRVKAAWGFQKGLNGLRLAPEYEDCKRLAESNAVSLESVYQLALRAAEPAKEALEEELRQQSASESNHGHSGHDHGGHDHGGHDHGGHDHGGHHHHH
ncbi:MAG: nickel pincer cofactor biosynthesis protein LarC [Planctomycetota bacterium]|nr:nickel pincer cofactor biosynthesis protein LarC [Planctomycetota bacterium]